MLRMTWIQEPGVLGTPPPECGPRPGFSECYAEAFKAALIEPECQSIASGVQKTQCIAYWADLRAAQNCRNICPEMNLPVKPAQWPDLPPPPAPIPPLRRTPPDTTPKKSNAGPVLIGLGLAALAIVAISASS